MFSGFGSGKGMGPPESFGNVPQPTNGARRRGDRTEADAVMTADPPTQRPGARDVPDAEASRLRAQGRYTQGRDHASQEMERLRDNARAALLNTQDVQLQDIIRRSTEAMAQMPGRTVPSSTEAIELVASMLDLANQRLEPRQAAIYLAYSHWDYTAAVARYLDERFGDNTESLSDPELDSEEADEEEEQDREAEEEDDSEDDDGDEFAQMRRLNRHVSRKGPIKGQHDDSLLVIHLRNPEGRPDMIRRYLDVHPGPVEWDRDLRAISRWRSQVFRRSLGNVREGRTKYHELEKQWLVDAHLNFKRRNRESGTAPNWRRMEWNTLAVEFNHHFQGQILPGNPRPRPARTPLSLRNERARIKFITDMTGLKPKDQGPKR